MPLNPRYVEESDSSATIMRGVAAALDGRWMAPQKWPRPLVALTGPANRLPEQIRLRLVDLFIRNLGVPSSLAGQVSAAGLAQWAADLYGSGEPDLDVVVVGAPSGGIGHLAALLGAPFLSEHFVTRFRYRGDPDDVAGYLAYGSSLARIILKNNPDLLVVNHYDPIHDRFLVPYVNYVRMKLLTLPLPYQEFIARRLRPGGTILFADCRYSWGQYRLGRRHYFQVGGLGGIADMDYVRGSPEVERFLQDQARSRRGKVSSPQRSWRADFPWLPQRESEWGSLQVFRQAVETYASEHNYRFVALTGSHPADFSRIAFYASALALRGAGEEPGGVLVECFTLTSPTGALQGRLLPLWLPFNCSDSLGFLRDMAPAFPAGRVVLLAPAPSYSPAWDIARTDEWAAACGPEANITWLGVNPGAYPADLAALFRFVPALQAWCGRAGRRAHLSLAMADLESLVRAGSPPGV